MLNEMERELHGGGSEGEIWPVFADTSSSTRRAQPLRIMLLADISGAGPDYHVGDEAMAEVAIKRFKELVGPDNLVMACAKPEAIQETYGIKSFAHYNLTEKARRKLWLRRPHSAMKSQLRLIYQLLRCDLVVVCGGGNMTSVWPDVLESRLHFLTWARRLKKPFYLVSQTLGPFEEKHREQVQDALAAAEWIGVRDKHYSAGQVNLPVKFAVDDAVFLKPRHSDASKAMMAELKDSMAVSLRNFGSANQGRLERLGRCINKIALRHKLSTVFIPHHSPNGGGDTAIGQDLEQQWLGARPFKLLHPIPMASELKAITADCKLVITMRYHQLIFALSTGVPVVGIYVNEYTQAKLNGAFEQFNLKPRTLAFKEAEEKLPSLVQELLNEGQTFEAASQQTLRESLKENMSGINRLKELHLASAD